MSPWMAALAACLAVWWWLPPDGVIRLSPGDPPHLPSWAKPLPEAMDSKKRWLISGALAILVVGYGWDLSPFVVAVVPFVVCGGWVALGRLEPSKVRRTRQETLDAVPQALDLLHTCLRAGQPLRTAVVTVARAMGPPISRLFDDVTQAQSVGMSDEQAWLMLVEDPALGVVARDIARSATWGTAITDVLAQHGRDLRRYSARERLKAAKAVGVKSVLPLGLCYLPAFVLMGVVPVIAAGISGLFG